MDIFIIIYSYKDLHYNLKMAIKYTTIVILQCVIYKCKLEYNIFCFYN